jgi:hypothetical protein
MMTQNKSQQYHFMENVPLLTLPNSNIAFMEGREYISHIVKAPLSISYAL